ncbi:MAG: hypothetical protein WD894_19300 [Pirellulales bacterium]
MNDWASQTIEEESAGEIERLWLEQRGRAAEILAAQKTRLDEIELRFSAQLELISTQLASEGEGLPSDHHAEVERLRAELDARQLQLQQDQEKTALEFQQWSNQLRQKQQELERRAEDVESRSQQLIQQERRAETGRQEHDAEMEQLARRKARFEEQHKHLEHEHQALEAQRAEINEQRQRIARQLKQQRAKQLEELEHRRAELAATRDGELGRLREECGRLAAESARHQTAWEAQVSQNSTQLRELEEARRQIVHLQEELHAATELAHGVEEQLTALRTAHDTLERQASANAADSEAGQTSLESLRRERDQLAQKFGEANSALETVRTQAAKAGQSAEAARVEVAKQLEMARQETAAAAQRICELETRLTAAQSNDGEVAGAGTGVDSQQLQDLQRRFELAVEDVRSLKRRNADLEDQMAAHKAGRNDAQPSAQGQDWESLKKRMLAELEADTGPSPARKEEQLSIENAIRITDDVVSQKDREIEELKQVLSHQSDNLGSVAVGAAAVEEMFNQDELIRQERERLQQAQVEWRDKLRQAEIDVSLERARIARERVELEEKLQALAAERAQNQHPGSGQPNEKGGKPSRGRWLERLGLKDSEK